MYNTTNGNQPYFRIYNKSSYLEVDTNVILINRDIANLDNLKLSFIKDEDCSDSLPYMFIGDDGKYTFQTTLPSCNTLTACIKINNEKQYEFVIELEEFYLVTIDPADDQIDVPIAKSIIVDMNVAFKESDLVSGKVWLEEFYASLTTDLSTLTADLSSLTTDQSKE